MALTKAGGLSVGRLVPFYRGRIHLSAALVSIPAGRAWRSPKRAIWRRRCPTTTKPCGWTRAMLTHWWRAAQRWPTASSGSEPQAGAPGSANETGGIASAMGKASCRCKGQRGRLWCTARQLHWLACHSFERQQSPCASAIDRCPASNAFPTTFPHGTQFTCVQTIWSLPWSCSPSTAMPGSTLGQYSPRRRSAACSC